MGLAIATGSGVLRLRSSVTGASSFFANKRQSELKIMPDLLSKNVIGGANP